MDFAERISHEYEKGLLADANADKVAADWPIAVDAAATWQLMQLVGLRLAPSERLLR